MVTQTLPYDASIVLIDDPAEQIALLSDALASGEPGPVIGALQLIARATGVSTMARETGLSREAIYKATGTDGNPTLATLLGMLRTAGIRLVAMPAR
jgi:probable addiction module antidote protein